MRVITRTIPGTCARKVGVSGQEPGHREQTPTMLRRLSQPEEWFWSGFLSRYWTLRQESRGLETPGIAW